MLYHCVYKGMSIHLGQEGMLILLTLSVNVAEKVGMKGVMREGIRVHRPARGGGIEQQGVGRGLGYCCITV